MGWGNDGASLTGFSRATRAWGRPSAGSPAHTVTAVTAVPRRDTAMACRSLGGHDLAVTAVTTVIVGPRIPRSVTAVITAPAVTAVTRRTFVSMASDVASQGGGAVPGRDRHRRAHSAVRARWRGGPSPGTASGHRGEARKPRAAGPRRPRLKGKGLLIRGSSGNFICGFRAHPKHGNRREGLHRLRTLAEDRA
jgi:hypothetical protein